MPGADSARAFGSGPLAPALLLGLFVLAWLLPLGVRPLFEPDEGRYAEIPREMLSGGDWATPHLDGFKYFEKPALQYWGTAAFYRLFGVSEFTSRLRCALTGILLGFVVWRGGHRLFGARAGRFAALLFPGFLMVPGMALFNTLDMGVTCFLGIALVAFCIAQSSREEPARLRNWMLVTYAAMALAVLSKGLIGVILPGGTMIAYSLWNRDREMWRRLHPLPGLAVFLAIAAPWYLLVSLRNPDFASFFFLREHFARFLTDSHRRGKPFFFFLLVLPAGLLPFTIPAVRAHVAAIRRKVTKGDFDASRLLVTWTLLILAFFSLSHSKLVGYIGPVLPAIALVTGAFLARAPAAGLSGAVRVGGVLAILLLLLAGVTALPFVRFPRVPPESLHGISVFLAGGGLALGAGAWFAWRRLREGRGLACAAALALAVTVAVSAALPGLGVLKPGATSEAVADAMRPRLGTETRIFSVNRYDQSLPFYLGRKVTVVKYRGELEFGIDHDPARWIPDYPEFALAWAAAPDPIGVVSLKTYEREILPLGISTEVLYETPDRVVFVKPRP